MDIHYHATDENAPDGEVHIWLEVNGETALSETVSYAKLIQLSQEYGPEIEDAMAALGDEFEVDL